MKNKLFAILAAFGMVASASAVKINNNLSINGFIDGSYKLVDSDTAAENDQGLDADEAEINFVLSNGPVSGLIAIDSAKSVQELMTSTSSKLISPTILVTEFLLLLVVMVLHLVSSVKILLVFTLSAVHTAQPQLTSETSTMVMQ